MNTIALKLECSLTHLDWRVVAIARSDGPRSINPDRRCTQIMQNLLGLPVARKLANEKLEALRRFCVRAWFWDLIRTGDVRAFMEAGYTRVDVLQILAHVASFRGFTPSVEEGV